MKMLSQLPYTHHQNSPPPNNYDPRTPIIADISDNLSLPDTELLKWSEEDKSTHPGADKLGADLLLAQDLYRDLQEYTYQ